MLVLGLHSEDRKSTKDKANINNPKVNRGCPLLTANRISRDCVQISLGPAIHNIPLRVYRNGGFNAMSPGPSVQYIPLGVNHTGDFNAMYPGHKLRLGNESLEVLHYSDVIMDAIASQTTSLTIVYSTVYSGADHRKYQSSPSLAFVRGIHSWPVIPPHKWQVTRKICPFDDVIMCYNATAAAFSGNSEVALSV